MDDRLDVGSAGEISTSGNGAFAFFHEFLHIAFQHLHVLLYKFMRG